MGKLPLVRTSRKPSAEVWSILAQTRQCIKNRVDKEGNMLFALTLTLTLNLTLTLTLTLIGRQHALRERCCDRGL